jgi:glycosyltransferase involved in cell wall biosynthesis
MNKISIAFIGRKTHENTRSDQFLIDILKPFADVVMFRKERLSSGELVKQVNDLSPDVIVYFQLPPSFARNLWSLKCRNHVWVPMWDGFNFLNWRKRLAYQYYRVRVLSFCRQIDKYVKSVGLSSLSVQCFPPPMFSSIVPKAEPPYAFFLWQRQPEINIDALMQMVGVENIAKVTYKGDQQVDISRYPFDIEILPGWIDKDEYLLKMAEADFYVAPRWQEGIGFSFLEAMALGKVILGHDDATMNEYIINGMNGFLFDRHLCLQEPLRPPAVLQEGLQEHYRQKYDEWLNSHQSIKKFILGDL